jgi:hypothetical protein
VLAQVLDAALDMFGNLRAKIDEVLDLDIIKEIKSLWVSYKPSHNAYMKRYSVAAIDSGFNYKEFRGYALYVQNTAWVIVDAKGNEDYKGSVDIDLASTSNIEYELSLLSLAKEVDAMMRLVTEADIVLVDGSIVAMFSKLRRATMESDHELLSSKKINVDAVLKNLLITLSLYPRKFVFLSKNSTAKDLLGFVKGDVYYFERYTDGVPGYTKPLNLAQSKHLSIAFTAKMFSHTAKNVTGMRIHIYMSYVRLEPFSRVYRMEIVSSDDEPVEPRIRSIIDVLSQHSFSGYPYPLVRADQLARVGNADVERIATVLGIAEDPYGREPI